jgi:hypothetical protein
VGAAGVLDRGRAVQQPRVYVLCPARLVTGGTELLHQLVGQLVAGGRDARIVYLPMQQGWQTPDAFIRYGCRVAESVPDEPNAAVIVPEVSTRELYRFKKAQHVVWWLSVDNYRGGTYRRDRFFHYVRRLVIPEIPNPKRTAHLFQSAYARDFVSSRFGCGGPMLTDYLADEYAQSSAHEPRSDAVAFNPQKGWAFTRRFLAANPQIMAVPLANMSRSEVRRALESCKVYIDFGEHPGKDRMPREAAACGAVVIVGKRGAAVNDEDVPLPMAYKLPVRRSSLYRLNLLVQEVFSHFTEHQQAQQAYRDVIRRDKAMFRHQMREVFGLD